MFNTLPVAELTIIIAVAAVISIVLMLPWFFIYRKAGFHPAMGCLMFVPLVNLVMMFILAFSEWPIERELRGLRIARAHNE